MNHFVRKSLAALLCLGSVSHASAASAQTRPTELAAIPLEELMRIEITSASRKEQRADAVAAAVFVITHDDIGRSGIRTLPELFRLAPGVQVAQVNANNWVWAAVSYALRTPSAHDLGARINVDTVNRSQPHVSSRLLGVARIVRDDHGR